DVQVVPTTVDSDAWAPAEPPADGPTRLLWIGSPTTLSYLEDWAPALARLATRHTVELHVIGAVLHGPGVRCVSHAWSLASERTLAARCHVGWAPLRDGDWERGKCGLRLLLYMALGLPAVASDAGVQAELLAGGECGVLVRGVDGLEGALERLLVDRAERARL